METKKEEIYTTITLANGTYCTFIVPNAGNYSRAIRKQSQSTEYDLFLFFTEEFCKFDGKRWTLEQVSEIYCDDYLKIIEVLGRIITPIK